MFLHRCLILPIKLVKLQRSPQNPIHHRRRQCRPLLAQRQLLRHQDHIADLPSVNIQLRPPTDLSHHGAAGGFVGHPDVVEEVGPYLAAVGGRQWGEVDGEADAGFEGFVDVGDEVSCQDEDTAVVFKFAEEGWARGLVIGVEGEEEGDADLRSKSVGSFA
jgi:hypothetical protein